MPTGTRQESASSKGHPLPQLRRGQGTEAPSPPSSPWASHHCSEAANGAPGALRPRTGGHGAPRPSTSTGAPSAAEPPMPARGSARPPQQLCCPHRRVSRDHVPNKTLATQVPAPGTQTQPRAPTQGGQPGRHTPAGNGVREEPRKERYGVGGLGSRTGKTSSSPCGPRGVSLPPVGLGFPSPMGPRYFQRNGRGGGCNCFLRVRSINGNWDPLAGCSERLQVAIFHLCFKF